MQAFVHFKQKTSHRNENRDEEAATNVGVFELVNCKEVQQGALGFIESSVCFFTLLGYLLLIVGLNC